MRHGLTPPRHDPDRAAANGSPTGSDQALFGDPLRSASGPRPTALPEMATAVIILNEDREIEYVNASAEALFAGVDPIGCTMEALLTSCGARGVEAARLSSAADEPITCTRVHLADSRVLDCEVRPLSNGGFVLSLDDVTDHVRSAELANRDPLTGLANRTLFHHQLLDRLEVVKRNSGRVAILLIDLDRFKAINDTLGHPLGDALLRKVSARLTGALRDEDVAARLGGDEFGVIQSAAEQPDAAELLAARLVDLIGRTYVLEGHTIHIGATIGVTVAPRDGLDADVLLKNADLALYQAKAAGKGTFRVYETGMTERIQARRLLEIDLRRALALKQFDVVYQPQVDIATGAISGFEALIRWQHPVRGPVSPGEFIPAAEEIGIISAVSEWVLRTACREAMSWPGDISVAVNLSPVQFRNGRLLEVVTSALSATGLPASRLELEITEGALLENSDAVLAVLRSLRALGIRISMDDFGTGYSSLSYLQKFPLDKIKIDRSFIRNIDHEPDRLHLVRAIAALAKGLGMKTTAEGVETLAELQCVRSEGCTEVQGYFTGRPVPAREAAALLSSGVQGSSSREND
ncbi:putative bifunctional diguanylate cyclase/phosphodiesterase [Enterovirga rhinocerotis]|uniref:Diguanylate cyclase (GGDEF)-like protein n=1 Tax=Enterovirga rhinocerotis TaxID=1339210 RepID=A0A4R7BVN3_9HYPH|nr:EAL domain-containing protein [Enterovirga rhinocerotis]TDR89928.1 diguanylate cyclase (GGDEF)-like protein [Enterovirga rhinocerotis]